MISGFFYKEGTSKRQIKKCLLLVLYSNALYMTYKLGMGVWGNHIAFKKVFQSLINLKTLWQWLLFNKSPFAMHLWYISALLYVLIVVWFYERFKMGGISKIIPVLLGLNLLLGKYSYMFLKRSFPVFVSRNFLFLGIPYFLIGINLRENQPFSKINRRSGHSQTGPVASFLILTVAEESLLQYFGVSASADHYISTPFLCVTVFSLFVNGYVGENTIFSRIGQKYATCIYVVHPMVVNMLDGICKGVAGNLLYQFMKPFVVYSVSILVGMIFKSIKIK